MASGAVILTDEAPDPAMEIPENQYDPHAPQERAERELEFSRIVAFSDGVIAIAITLLVLNLEVPAGVTDFGAYLADLRPELLSFALSFAVIAQFWSLHHRFFGALARFDGRLLNLNLLFLACIVLVPFTTDLLDEYSTRAVPSMLYAATLGTAALVNWVMVAQALRRDLVYPAARASLGGFEGRRGLVIPAIFFVSIPLALASPLAAQLCWLTLLIRRSAVFRRALSGVR